MRTLISGRCARCNTWARRLLVVPCDEQDRSGRPLFEYVCETCFHGGPDPFDDPEGVALEQATEADLQ